MWLQCLLEWNPRFETMEASQVLGRGAFVAEIPMEGDELQECHLENEEELPVREVKALLNMTANASTTIPP